MNTPLPFLIAADWVDALKALVPLIFLALWVFSQLAEAKKQGAEEPKPKSRPQPQRPGAPGERPAAAMARGEVAAPAVKPAEDNVRAEVEEFLRRVRQQGEGEQRPKRVAEPPRRPRIEVLVDESAEQVARPVVPAERQRPLPSQQAASASVAERRETTPAEPLVMEPVPLERRHLADSRVTERARHLGEEIGQSDERLEAHLHQKFDHHLGKLSSREPTPAEQVAAALATTPASEIAALLATPQGMQQAVVLSEILRRPLDRW